MSKGRVEAFSDGVFAVAATLLIFNIQLDRTAPSPIAVVIVCAALGVYYLYERLPDISSRASSWRSPPTLR